MKTLKRFFVVLAAAVLLCAAVLPAIGVETAETAQAAAQYTQTYETGTSVFSNGKYSYYMTKDSNANYYLIKKTVKTGKTKTIKKFKMTGESAEWADSYSVTAVYAGNVYICRTSESQWKKWTYVYNLKKGKVIKKYANKEIIAVSGSSVVVQHEYVTDVSPTKQSLYKLTAKGMKKVKSLGNNVRQAEFVSGKLYYAVYPNADSGKLTNMDKTVIYRINKNGKNKKKLCSYKVPSTYGGAGIYIQKYTKKYCIFTYYTSSTGNVTKKVKYK